MKGFTIYSLSKHAELGSLLESYCQRIGKLSSSNHDLDSLFSLLFEVSILFTEEKACYKTMGTVINRQNEIERNIAEMEKGIQETAPCINKLRKIFKGLQNTLYNERKPKMYINSEMFYKQQIEQLDKKEKELDDALQRLDDNIGDLVPPVAVFWYRRFTLSDFSYRLSGTAPESVL